MPLTTGGTYGVFKYSREEVRNFIQQGLQVDIRRLHEDKQINRREEEFYLFGAFTDEEKKITGPRDPLVETILIPGNPQALAVQCNRRAIFFTVLAVLALSAGIAGNLFIIINIFHLFLR